jgi:hypothetical protein
MPPESVPALRSDRVYRGVTHIVKEARVVSTFSSTIIRQQRLWYDNRRCSKTLVLPADVRVVSTCSSTIRRQPRRRRSELPFCRFSFERTR